MEYPGRPAGTWAGPPTAIMLHGSRSGKAGNPMAAEFLSTCRWCVTNPDELAWHCTVGDGVYAVHLDMQHWGWHAREASRTTIGVEFAQPTVDDAIIDSQVTAFAAWYRAVVLPAWPHLAMPNLLLPAHSETVPGVRDGKTDVFPKGDARNDGLRARLYAAIAPATTTYNVGPGVLSAMARHGDVPMSNEDYLVNQLSMTAGRDSLYLYHADSDTVFKADRA